MFEITLCFSNGPGHQATFERLITAGAAQHGIVTHGKSLDTNVNTKYVACWGWRRGKMLREQGHEVLVFERGYLGDRMVWTSIGWNGLNNNADFCLPDKVEHRRFLEHYKLEPWKNHRGDKIIIAGQVVGDASLKGADLTSWCERTAKELEVAHDLPVFYKPHPAARDHSRNFHPRIPKYRGDMQAAIQEAAAIVCWNSNASVDAVVAGCPALTFDQGAMAYPVTGHTAGDILTPDREEWAARLAHCQWSFDEIKSGAFWERMLCKVAV